MPASLSHDKYTLRALHEEIALADRKLLHLQKYETFASEKDRIAAAAKVAVKRGQLIKNAQILVDAGIEFSPMDQPRSMRSTDAEPEPSQPLEATPAARATPIAPHEGTVLDFRQEIAQYLEARRKTGAKAN